MNRPERTPLNWQQLLAAYADGELDAADCAKVRNWLEAHPDGYSKLEEQRGLSPANVPFWESVQPVEPSAAAWARVWNEVESLLEPARPARPRGWWRRGILGAVLALPATAAAAVVIATCLPTNAPSPVFAPPAAAVSEEIFQVVAAGDVEILSIRDADVEQLVVGEQPFNNAMMLVTAGEVRLQDLRPASDGMVPEARMGGNDAPMIYAHMPRTP